MERERGRIRRLPLLLLAAALLLVSPEVSAQSPPAPAKRRVTAALVPGIAFFETNQQYIDGLRSPFDPGNTMRVFTALFRKLPRDVFIHPTENYYYFSFLAAGRLYRGNFRLSAENRDRGLLNFIYYEYQDEPSEADDAPTWFASLGAPEGVRVRKSIGHTYRVDYAGKTVFFHLPSISQNPPAFFRLGPEERFIERICDESGYGFLLLFNDARSAFLWVLDEDSSPIPSLDSLSPELFIDRLSGFVFYGRPSSGRKVLVGVSQRNVRRNNYWDGPFDQLAENDTVPALPAAIEQAYPYTRGRIDLRGNFKEESGGGRMSITPYQEYETIAAMVEFFTACKSGSGSDPLPCLTHDYKTDFGRDEP